MKKIINPQMTLFALGILQPATAQEVRGFLTTVFSEGGKLPDLQEFSDFLMSQCKEGRAIRVFENGNYYSLTPAGANYLAPKLRRSRDKFRMYLLRDAHRARIIESRGVSELELVGASPSVDTSSDVKGRAAKKLGRTAFGRRFAYGQPYWPRIQGQFARRTGLSRTPRDTFPNLLSFTSEEQVDEAIGSNFKYDYFGIGLCLGVSPQLVWQIAHAADLHYRSFTIRKKGGGERLIESPRVFLKVIQWFLSDFVLDDLVIHPAVHSFEFGRSIVTNAISHERQPFVGAIDIENFFGSVRREAVATYLVSQGFSGAESEVISLLCTKQDRLPQGAPTSPVIANGILYNFDTVASNYCANSGLRFSRYADDITVSGPSRGAVAEALAIMSRMLEEIAGLKVNDEKTRIASKGGQQRVTGVVVNERSAPPRRFRRRIRAAFHRAMSHPLDGLEKLNELSGYLGYLLIFPKLRGSPEVIKYDEILRGLRRQRTAQQ